MIKQLLTSALSGIKQVGPLDQYPFSSLWINGRLVSFEKLTGQNENPRTPFEQTTFQFIREWLSGVDSFEMTTSGSTGPPKVISLNRTTMVASALQTSARLGLSKSDRALVCIDTRYIGGKMMLVRCLTTGMHITAVDPVANPLVKIPVDKSVEFTALVPYQISAVLESKHPHLLNNIDKILIGGAAQGLKNQEQLQRFQCACYETYGMTETASHIALRLVNTNLKQLYFQTLPNIKITMDNRGCLVIKAAYLPAAVVTNDLVQIIDSDKFIWLGRWDSVINSGGVKVMPEKIEHALEKILYNCRFNNRFFIAASPDEKLGNKIILVIEGVQFSSERLMESLDQLKKIISPFEFPKELYYVPEFAMTQSQKIDRNQTLPEAIFVSSLF